jgi:hypothetical protein
MTQRAQSPIIYQKLVQVEWTIQPQKKTLLSFPFFAFDFFGWILEYCINKSGDDSQKLKLLEKVPPSQQCTCCRSNGI